MPKLTLLEITQDILNSMDSDQVSTITETIESDQVAQIIKTTYYELLDRRDWPHLKELFQLTVATASQPTHMLIPDTIVEVREVRYNKIKDGETRDRYELIEYLHPEDFLRHINSRNSDASNIDSITDDSGVTLLIVNDKQPEFYTSFDDETLVFDAYNATDEGAGTEYLKDTKTQCFGLRQPTWTADDSFVPDLPIEAFSLLVAEAKAVAQFQVRQFVDQKAEQQAQRQRFRMSRKSWKAHKQDRYPDYGFKRARRSVPPRD